MHRTPDNAAREVATAGPPRLGDLDDWQSLLDESRRQPVLVFKHSTSCEISAAVFDAFRRYAARGESPPARVVHVIEDRALSDAIAERTGVAHESPQLIAIRNQRPVWHASHWSIDLDALETRLRETA